MLRKKSLFALACVLCLSLATAAAASAAAFDWQKHKGKTITFITSNHPWSNAVLKYQDEFTTLTGIKLKVDTFQEQQARQRMLTILQSKSSDMDVFMSLKSRDGWMYDKAGWYADLYPLTKSAMPAEYKFDDFGKGPLSGEIINNKLTGIPLNVEGPVLYYRKDVLKDAGVQPPQTLEDLEVVCKAIKAKRPDIIPWATRGLKPALPFTFSVFLHNMGGEYVVGGKSNLAHPTTKKAMAYYANLLRDYGPPGSVNNTFYQTSALYRDGRVAMDFEATNEFNSIMEGGARLNDTGIMLLPPAKNGQNKPTVIGWGVSVSNFSKQKEAAWYFIMWATSPEMQERLIADGIMPPRISALKSKTFNEWTSVHPIRQEWANAVIKISELGTSNVFGPDVINQAEGRDIVGNAVNEIMLGTRTVDDAAANANRLLDAMLKKEKK